MLNGLIDVESIITTTIGIVGVWISLWVAVSAFKRELRLNRENNVHKTRIDIYQEFIETVHGQLRGQRDSGPRMVLAYSKMQLISSVDVLKAVRPLMQLAQKQAGNPTSSDEVHDLLERFQFVARKEIYGTPETFDEWKNILVSFAKKQK